MTQPGTASDTLKAGTEATKETLLSDTTSTLTQPQANTHLWSEHHVDEQEVAPDLPQYGSRGPSPLHRLKLAAAQADQGPLHDPEEHQPGVAEEHEPPPPSEGLDHLGQAVLQRGVGVSGEIRRACAHHVISLFRG